MAHQSHMKSVLETALEVAKKKGGLATVGDVSSTMFAKTRKEHKRVINTLSQLYQNGRLARVRQGVYGPIPASGKTLEKREIMKNIVNIRKKVTVDDMVEMADVTKEYAREWLRLMTVNGALRKEQAPGLAAVWYRVREIVELPNDTEKADRLRKIRLQNKQQMTTRLDAIDTTIGEIRTLLNTMED